LGPPVLPLSGNRDRFRGLALRPDSRNVPLRWREANGLKRKEIGTSEPRRNSLTLSRPGKYHQPSALPQPPDPGLQEPGAPEGTSGW
jgi:hypothetical protein